MQEIEPLYIYIKGVRTHMYIYTQIANKYLSQVTVIYIKLKAQLGTINYLIQGRSKNAHPHPFETLKMHRERFL